MATLLVVAPRQGYLRHLMPDQAVWRSQMQPGRMLIWGTALCGFRAASGWRLYGRPEAPMPVSEARRGVGFVCESCMRRGGVES